MVDPHNLEEGNHYVNIDVRGSLNVEDICEAAQTDVRAILYGNFNRSCEQGVPEGLNVPYNENDVFGSVLSGFDAIGDMKAIEADEMKQ